MLIEDVKKTAAERETRVSTVLRDESPKRIVEVPAPISPVAVSPEPTVSPVSISPTTKIIKEKSNNGRSDAPTPGLSVKTKKSIKSIRKTVKKSEKDGANRDETGDSSLNQIDKIDLMAESKYKDSVGSPSKSPRTSMKKKGLKNDELTIKLTEQANELKIEISEIKGE
jgi:hypothetical protein